MRDGWNLDLFLVITALVLAPVACSKRESTAVDVKSASESSPTGPAPTYAISSFSDEWAAHLLRSGERPAWLDLTCSEVTDFSMSLLGELAWKHDSSGLRKLRLLGTSVTDEGLEGLGDLPTLEELTIESGLIVGSGLRWVGALRHLRDLTLDLPNLDPVHLRFIDGLPNLRRLTIACAAVTDSDLCSLARLNDLRSLDVTETQVRGHGLAALSHLPRFGSVRVDSAFRTDPEYLIGLSSLPVLTFASLRETLLTQNEISQFVDQHPRLTEVETPTGTDYLELADRHPGVWFPAGEYFVCGDLVIPDLGFKRRTPLMDSIWLRDDEGFRDFLKSGVDPDEIADCETIELNRGTSWPERTSAAPLFAAALVGELRYVEALLSAGADPNRSADNGSCSLHAATANGSVAIVDALIDAGAHPDPQDRYGKTPLMLAAQYRYLDVVDRLLTAGADADLGDVHRQTARDFARWGRYPEIAERLERSE